LNETACVSASTYFFSAKDRFGSNSLSKIESEISATTAESIADLAPALIKARIMRNWSQKELADKLAVAEQQVQRYEATQYKGVSVERPQAVADALRLRVREVITFEPL
jgi:ribosome-binding protein aMBF1 (putative translation factor)